MTHTPGPWNAAAFTVQHSNGGEIATVAAFGDHDNEAQANATLLAASPDLLEALRQIADQSAYAQDAGSNERINAIALAAIAKAEGRQ